MSAAGYSFDTNVFLDWWERRYPPDIFPAVQERMEELAASGRLKAVQGVFKEIQHIGSPGLKAWAKTNKNLFVPHDRSIQQAAAAIHRQFPGSSTSTPHMTKPMRMSSAWPNVRD